MSHGWLMVYTYPFQQERSSDDDPRLVLRAMASFVRHFFGCRECARHFLAMAEADAKEDAFQRDVKTRRDAELWLWRAHNRVNQRLSGDITDDPAFPKQTFPGREHCSDCYNNRAAGSDLWREFRLPKVHDFLVGLYGQQAISMEGLAAEKSRVQGHRETHDLAMVAEVADGRQHSVDTHNFNMETNQQSWSLFSPSDVRLMSFVYLISAAILVVVYLKFVARRCGNGRRALLAAFRHGSAGNPLLGKV